MYYGRTMSVAILTIVAVFLGLTLWGTVITVDWAIADTVANRQYLASTGEVWLCQDGWKFKEVQNPPGLIFIPKPDKLHRCMSLDGREEVQAHYVRLTHKEIAEIPLSQRPSRQLGEVKMIDMSLEKTQESVRRIAQELRDGKLEPVVAAFQLEAVSFIIQDVRGVIARRESELPEAIRDEIVRLRSQQ